MWTQSKLRARAEAIAKNLKKTGPKAVVYDTNRTGKPVFTVYAPEKVKYDAATVVGTFTRHATPNDIFEAMLVMVQEHGEAA